MWCSPAYSLWTFPHTDLEETWQFQQFNINSVLGETLMALQFSVHWSICTVCFQWNIATVIDDFEMHYILHCQYISFIHIEQDLIFAKVQSLLNLFSFWKHSKRVKLVDNVVHWLAYCNTSSGSHLCYRRRWTWWYSSQILFQWTRCPQSNNLQTVNPQT
jgi:hypothetical protein